MINQGDSIATVKTEIADALALVGVEAPTSWSDATAKLNARAFEYGLDGITDGMAGGTARARINAVIAGLETPTNVTLPTVTGDAVQGETLTTTTGTWTGLAPITYAYQWFNSEADITGATASTYVLTEDDIGLTVGVRVTATNVRGPVGVESDVTAPVTGGGGMVAVPAGFDWSVPWTISQQGGKFRVNVLPEQLRPADGVQLYVSPTGNNANNGTTPALAKRSIANAYNAGAGTIIAAPGDYTRTNGYEGIVLAARDLTIFNSNPAGGQVIIGRWEPPTSLVWTQNSTYPNVWSCTRSQAAAIRDRSIVDGSGNIARLAPRADIAAVAANPGSQFISGSTVHVSLADGRQPDANVLVFLSGTNWSVTNVMAGRTMWVGEGVEFWGGDTGFGTFGLSTASGTRIVMDRTRFKYATSATAGNALSIINVSETYLFGARAEASMLDGFNYHFSDGGIGKVLEVDCIGRANGLTGGPSNNGTSIHENGRIIRLNGLYIGSEGPQVADVNASQSWNLGCRASGGPTNWRTIDTAKMWLDSCVSDNAITDLDIGAGSEILTRNLTSGGVFAGVPTPY